MDKRKVKNKWNENHYTKKAKDENYKARSVYKLQEIDAKFKVLKRGMKVLDLGCAPGSWLQFVLKKIGAQGEAWGIDLKKCEIPGAITFKADINELPEELKGNEYDLLLSDMAPDTSGNNFLDSQRSLDLCRIAWQEGEKLLKNKGTFIFKVFQGEDLDDFIKKLRQSFKKISRFKPQSSRKKSFETFIICLEYKKSE